MNRDYFNFIFIGSYKKSPEQLLGLHDFSHSLAYVCFQRSVSNQNSKVCSLLELYLQGTFHKITTISFQKSIMTNV